MNLKRIALSLVIAIVSAFIGCAAGSPQQHHKAEVAEERPTGGGWQTKHFYCTLMMGNVCPDISALHKLDHLLDEVLSEGGSRDVHDVAEGMIEKSTTLDGAEMRLSMVPEDAKTPVGCRGGCGFIELRTLDGRRWIVTVEGSREINGNVIFWPEQ